ncbi:MAG: pyridoxine 5'-phosphate synthase, partial [Candidatus Omnitrophica bacterium]|nr:pyridoxine 5'-phosphate synthase [Candidatus Omnitrophota bacterium]
TEGGLDAASLRAKIKAAVNKFHSEDILVSLFIDPDKKQIKAAKDVGAEFIEIHTGEYANSKSEKEREVNLLKIEEATAFAHSIGLGVNAGHGLDYKNAMPVCKVKHIRELNIGYSIICRAVIVGLDKAVREMRKIIDSNSL